MKDFKHYLALMAMMSVAIAMFLFFNYNRNAQIGVVIVMAAVYVIWAMIHHSLKKDFHLKIILEYLLVAVLASTLVIFLLLRT